MTLDNEMTNIVARKSSVVMALSTALMLFGIGMVDIKNNGLTIAVTSMAIIFAFGFVIGTLFSDSRNGAYPWTLISGLIIAIVATVVYTCVFTGIMFSVNSGLSTINTDLLIYSLSACMILSVIALNIMNNLDMVAESIKNRMSKEQSEQYPLHDYNDSNETQEEYKI